MQTYSEIAVKPSDDFEVFTVGETVYRTNRDTGGLEVLNTATGEWDEAANIVSSPNSDRYVLAWDEGGQFWVEYDTETKTHKYLDINGNEIQKSQIVNSGYQYQYRADNNTWYRSFDHGNWTQTWTQVNTSNTWVAQNSAPASAFPEYGDGTLRNYDPVVASPTRLGTASKSTFPGTNPTASTTTPYRSDLLANGFPLTLTNGAGETATMDPQPSNSNGATSIKVGPDQSKGFVVPSTTPTMLTGLTGDRSFYKDLGGDQHLFIQVNGSSAKGVKLDLSSGFPSNIPMVSITTGLTVKSNSCRIFDIGGDKLLVVAYGVDTGSSGIWSYFIDYSGASPALAGTPERRTSTGSFDNWLPNLHTNTAFWGVEHDTSLSPEVIVFATDADYNSSGAFGVKALLGTIDASANTVVWDAQTNANAGSTPMTVISGHGVGMRRLSADKWFTLEHSGSAVYAAIYDQSTNVNLARAQLSGHTHSSTLTQAAGETFWGHKFNSTDLLFVDSNFLYKFRLNDALTAYNYWPVIGSDLTGGFGSHTEHFEPSSYTGDSANDVYIFRDDLLFNFKI